MLVEVCSQERSYLRFFGLLGQVSHLLCNSCNNPVHCTYSVVISKLLAVMKESDSDVQNTPFSVCSDSVS